MTDLQLELQSFDKSIEEHKKNVLVGEALERLKNNPDFKLVIEEVYFEDESKRVLNNLLTPNITRRDTLEDMADRLGSIRNLKAFIGTPEFAGSVLSKAENSEEEINFAEQNRKDLIADYNEAE